MGWKKITIGGFNSMIEKQKQESGKAFVNTVLFNSFTQVLHDRVPLEKIPAMTRQDYTVGGSTALLDALAARFTILPTSTGYARPEDRAGAYSVRHYYRRLGKCQTGSTARNKSKR